jgi:hypothetical protein
MYARTKVRILRISQPFSNFCAKPVNPVKQAALQTALQAANFNDVAVKDRLLNDIFFIYEMPSNQFVKLYIVFQLFPHLVFSLVLFLRAM